jgi:sodium transport system permease protein
MITMAVSFSGQGGGKPAFLVSLMSVFALVTTFTGGMAVAMDITAGERERRSLVPLLLTPITSRHLVLGKWLATCAFALGALAINLAGVAAVMVWRAPGAFSANAVPLASWVILGLAPLACFAAALLVLSSAACRTTKEASNWLTFVVFVPMLVGMFLVFYRVSGDAWLALPVVGQQLVVLRTLGGAPAPLLYGVGLALATAAATLPTLAAAARVLRRDQLLAG